MFIQNKQASLKWYSNLPKIAIKYRNQYSHPCHAPKCISFFYYTHDIQTAV